MVRIKAITEAITNLTEVENRFVLVRNENEHFSQNGIKIYQKLTTSKKLP